MNLTRNSFGRRLTLALGVGACLPLCACSSKSLQEAVAQNDGETVRRLVSADKANPPKDENGKLLLISAIRQEKGAAAKAMIEAGTDPNQTDPADNVTPLLAATQTRDASVVQLLLEKGADIKARTKTSQRTPLILAAFGGRQEMVQALLAKGADINAQDRSGLTALCFATRSQSIEIMKLLLEKGANPNLPTAAATPDKAPSGDVMGMAGGRPNSTPLYTGGEHLQRRSIVVPLHLAVLHGNVEAARLLLEKGADVEARESDGQTPLMRAVRLQSAGGGDKPRTGHTELVQLLLAKGANVNARDPQERTALMFAVQDANLMRLLLEKGADPNAQCKSARAATDKTPYPDTITAFGLAAARGNLAGMQLLQAKGAQVSPEQKSAALYAAFFAGHIEVARVLLQQGVQIAATLKPRLAQDMAEWGGAEQLQLLAEQGADWKTQAADGMTPLRAAMSRKNEKALEFLKSKGVTPTPEDEAFVKKLTE